MSKTGKTVFLTLLLLGVSGASSKSYAQEKLLPISIGISNTRTCTSLQTLLVTNASGCTDKKLSQVESAIKAVGQNIPDTTTEFSYATEPTYYVPPVPMEAPIITPTRTLSPTNPTQKPADNIPADGASLDSNLIFSLINQHRTQIGKPAFQKDPALCELAKTRSYELHDELFVNHNLHSGLYNRNLPYWITENAKWGSNEAVTVDWWLHSPIHRAAIEGNHVYSCGACNGTQCSQLFTSYTPKKNN